MNDFKILVIGCGSIGKRHIRNLMTLNAKNIMAFDVRSDRLSEVESEFGIEVVDTLENAWKLAPDVALITSPTSFHVPLALQAAEHGCHLFIEKPLSDNIDNVDQLLDTVKTQNLITMVGCNMRFHPGLMKVKTLLETEAIGRVIAGRVEAGQYLPDWHPSENYRQGYSARRDLGGGVILDAIHEIDYIRWMLGEVESIACFAGRLSKLEIETEDTAAMIMRFISCAIGEVHLDYIQRVHSRTSHIIGDEGTIRWDYSTGEVNWYSAETKKWQTFKSPHDWTPNQMYLDEISHYLRCLNKEEQPTLDVFQGARVLKIAIAAKASAEKMQFIRLDLRS